eukprot:CAMPEP_0168526582 /NCGR_PEP_ID=MMETSP0405-20121227/12067_1 /TAXON_ID=498012 /ORGANISM="Trichosphaerium sp, Strain Am-I-7 wt" /LENGTH=239 /DNA_ID=CAMNT_0008549479 /DNA_START=232 /DNA_END=948 /DNA_ORIENTATION=-
MVAVKDFSESEGDFKQEMIDEVNCLKIVKGAKHFPKLIDSTSDTIVTYPVGLRIRKIKDISDPVKFFSGSVKALQYLHGEGFVHRDISLSNLLLDGSGEPILIDTAYAVKSGMQVVAAGGIKYGPFNLIQYYQPNRVCKYSGRDDLLSLVYVMVYLYATPSQRIHIDTTYEKWLAEASKQPRDAAKELQTRNELLRARSLAVGEVWKPCVLCARDELYDELIATFEKKVKGRGVACTVC